MTGRIEPALPSRARTLWRPQHVFAASIGSRAQLAAFNDHGAIAVNFDVLRGRAPRIRISGGQSETFSLWETRSGSGFVTHPKFNARLVTVRFVTSGRITYHHRRGNFVGMPQVATLVGFDQLRSVEASPDFGAVSATIAVDVLAAAHGALTGDRTRALPRLETVAEVGSDGMRALYCTVARMQHRVAAGLDADLYMLPLLQEIMSYQLLSAWPRTEAAPVGRAGGVPARAMRTALDYIEANVARPLALSEIAAAAGVSVRALQDTFRTETGQSLGQFVIARRAQRLPADLADRPGVPVPRRPGGMPAPREDLLTRAQDLIERELHRADLSPARVAARLGISVRKLHLVFEPSGESFTRRVLARRLARADRLLRDAPDRSVTEVAYAAGFESLSTFFRSYRAAYGASPGERRAEAGRARDGTDDPA
ncbi:helix-turn-helix domain-containing protein [Methylobacterium sp. NEAU 140]|uniref:helix-turn-helix domain-containing protein n=1 Tax=Methylobacterium sp. NEAU 140 TaxID=3064945 RepID=UPI00273488A3|nr:helix-turn-helix domain-containing protein [Methylobacterium sp. NEAU 140]MDP4023407.1 helix-turn-helix domain-containing protein [Methylobacterium sp. NEAU 140]